MVCPDPWHQASSETEAWEWLTSAVAESADYANSRGVLFAFEAIANHLVSRTEDLQQLMNRVGDNRLWVNFDPSHFQVMGDDPVAAARTLADRTVHVHLKDAQGVPEDFTFPPLGEGRIDFDRMIVRASGWRLRRRPLRGVRGAGVRIRPAARSDPGR